MCKVDRQKVLRNNPADYIQKGLSISSSPKQERMYIFRLFAAPYQDRGGAIMNRELNIDQHQLVQAWQERLPELLHPGDHSLVAADGADGKALRIHIDANGRQSYSLDFACTYVDSREVQVQLVDVERDGQTIDERGDYVQELADHYTRHIHQCAQALQQITNP